MKRRVTRRPSHRGRTETKLPPCAAAQLRRPVRAALRTSSARYDDALGPQSGAVVPPLREVYWSNIYNIQLMSLQPYETRDESIIGVASATEVMRRLAERGH